MRANSVKICFWKNYRKTKINLQTNSYIFRSLISMHTNNVTALEMIEKKYVKKNEKKKNFCFWDIQADWFELEKERVYILRTFETFWRLINLSCKSVGIWHEIHRSVVILTLQGESLQLFIKVLIRALPRLRRSSNALRVRIMSTKCAHKSFVDLSMTITVVFSKVMMSSLNYRFPLNFGDIFSATICTSILRCSSFILRYIYVINVPHCPCNINLSHGCMQLWRLSGNTAYSLDLIEVSSSNERRLTMRRCLAPFRG